MKWLRRIILAILTLVVLAAGYYLYYRFQLAPVSPADLAPTVLVPSAPATAVTPPDLRLQGLSERPDGARLLWDNPESGAVLAAGFADNGSFVISATGPKGYRVFAVDLRSHLNVHELSSVPGLKRQASSSRSLNRNADAFCYSEATPPRNVLEIWCRNDAWENPRRLTNHDGNEDLVNPTISPDGSAVAFEVVAPGTRKSPGTTGTIWRIGLDGSGLKQLTRGADDRKPTWTDDGARIYFQRRLPDGSWDAYSMGAGGTNPMPVIQTFARDEISPVALPDSNEIVMVASASGTPSRVRLLDVETKAGEWLTGEGFGPESLASISPDGKLVSFVAPIETSATSTRLGVWLMPLAFKP